MRRFGHSLRWALVKAAVAGTTMVALAFLIPLGLMVQQTARDRAFTAAERQAAALGPALAITTDQDAINRALASTDAGGQGRMAVHLPAPTGAAVLPGMAGAAGTAGMPGAPAGGGSGAGASGTGGSGTGGSGTGASGAAPGGVPLGPAVGGGPGGPTIGTVRAASEAVGTARSQGRAFTVAVPGGYALLQPVAVDTGRTAVVEVFVAESDLTRGVATAWLVLSGVALGLVAISVLVADRMGSRIVASARRLATAARSLGTGNLTVRVPLEGKQAADSPEELREAAQAFNAMADRVVQLLAAERELAADLSHRLRTPLTVLRLNAASLGDGDAADATRHAVAQLEREVDQIIRAARRDPEDAQPAVPVGCDAAEVIRERVGFWSALAEDEGRPWQLAGAEQPAPVPVQRGDLAAVVDALLGNVFRHTAVGTAFSVDVLVAGSSVIVLVGDAGPGFADPATALRRGEGDGGEGSTGLGLDIVRKLAESTGGDLALGRSAVLGGAEVRLRMRTRPSEGEARAGRRRSRGALFQR
ncbi:sensor histidine kinase [Kitasatospora sp. NPDC051170]|uniref:sensor histidine kinase n=1 Tax=Kitasatospora sp. NPDC051170 TaxID=3364056 RepID=UPI0037959B26